MGKDINFILCLKMIGRRSMEAQAKGLNREAPLGHVDDRKCDDREKHSKERREKQLP